MDEKEPPPAFMSALTTEHFVLQDALSANTSEVGTLREKQTLLASLIGAGVALALMAVFLVYQKWRYDSAS